MKGKATKKQMDYILLLLSHLSPEDVVSITKEYDLNNLTKKQASKLIEELIELKNRRHHFY